MQGNLEHSQHELDKQFYRQLAERLSLDSEHLCKKVDLQSDIRQGVDDDSESLAAELRLMEEFFFQGLPFPQGRRFFCPVTNCPTHLVMGFGCIDSLCSHLNSVHQTTLRDIEKLCGWSSVLLTQNLPLQSAQMFSDPNAVLLRNAKSRSAFVSAPSKVGVGFVSERRHHSLETLLSHLSREKSAIQERVDACAKANQEREAQKLRDIAARRQVIGELLPKLDSAISRLKSETGSKLTQAILDIGNLAFHSPHVRSEIMLSNVLAVIFNLLQSRSEAHREHAASAIKNLCLDLEHQRAFRKAGCIPPLVALLRGTRMQRKESLCALVNLVRGDPGSVGNTRNQRAVIAAGGLEEIRQINETANDSVRQLTESALAWMDTFDPSAAHDDSSEAGDCETSTVADIQVGKASIVSLDRCIAETRDALAKLAEFRTSLPSIQVVHATQPQVAMQQSSASYQPPASGSYSYQSSSSQLGRQAGSHDGPRRLGVRSAAVTHKYFTLIGNLDYRCNSCGVTVRDGTRDYHLKRYHADLVHRVHEDINSIGANPGNDGEKKISVLSVVYDNLGDLNFKCKLCGKLVRDGSRDYHIKQFHGDRMEELKEKKRQIIAERAASDSARRVAQISTPSAPAVQPPEFGSRSSYIGASFLSAGNSVKSNDHKPPSAKSHHKKVSSSEHAEPREPKALSQWQIEEIKKKGVSLRENEKLRNTIIETITSFMDEDICCAFRNDEGTDDVIVAKSAFTSPQVSTPGL